MDETHYHIAKLTWDDGVLHSRNLEMVWSTLPDATRAAEALSRALKGGSSLHVSEACECKERSRKV